MIDSKLAIAVDAANIVVRMDADDFYNLDASSFALQNQVAQDDMIEAMFESMVKPDWCFLDVNIHLREALQRSVGSACNSDVEQNTMILPCRNCTI